LKQWLRNNDCPFTEKRLEDETVNLIMKNIVVASAPILEVEGFFLMENQIFDDYQNIQLTFCNGEK